MSSIGQPCNQNGIYLPPGTPPTPLPQPENPAAPFEDPVEMSQGNVDKLMELWTLTMLKHDDFSPFENHATMHKIIDQIEQGDAPWKCFITQVDSDLPANAPSWQRDKYQIWYRDPDTVISHILASPDFCVEFDPLPYIHVGPDGKRQWCDFMSGNYAWRQSVQGAMYVGIILGSDKTTVSVATGNVEYHPLYISIGNIFNSARHAHRNAVVPIGFLAIPKGDRKYDDDAVFCIFKKQLYHMSVAAILQSLKPAMTQPVIHRCPDGHFCRVVYDLAAFIADYPEQVLLAGIVSALSTDLDGEGGHRTEELTRLLLDKYGGGDGQMLWFNYGIDENIRPFTFDFPWADIHQILTSDLLHQVIKGSFKDHLVDIAATPTFPGLRRFPHARRFKQWTGNDSKALMKVYLPAVADYLPEEMTQCLASFLDFCYLVQHADFDEDTLNQVDTAVTRFHLHHNIFITTGVRDSISLPCQHSLVHYRQHILDFGAPNAVKKPWRRSNHYNALSQMLLTNQRSDKLTALCAELVSFGLVTPNHPPPDPFDIESEDAGAVDEPILAEVKLAITKERAYPRSLERLAIYTHHPELPSLTCRFLYDQLRATTDPPSEAIFLEDCLEIMSHVYVYHSTITSFYAPSDISGSTPSWHRCPRRDCAFVVENDTAKGFDSMSVVRILLLFSFTHEDITYPCALVRWFKQHGRHPDKKTGLWVVKPKTVHGNPVISIVHLDTIFHGTHLLPVYGSHPVSHKFDYAYTLDCFRAFYVNKYADHHTNEIIFS
ncbi:hypothetical protein ARMGADRAFT_1048787 [Armillaria gallica]|uniref:Uncharacterized protein n=1 Tax=Armillaria gallica TaxID=47427 RepID=A0A2H3CJX7_ARMGA|nr:hypothetical protein ARMGADRAFT_1048787 [Armillaria gallica]